MLAMALLVLACVALSIGGLRPLVLLLTPLFDLSWLPWLGLILLLWLIADDPAPPAGRDRPGC